MPKLRSAYAIQLGDVEFIATLEFPTGMQPLQVHVLQVWCIADIDKLYWHEDFLNRHMLDGTFIKRLMPKYYKS